LPALAAVAALLVVAIAFVALPMAARVGLGLGAALAMALAWRVRRLGRRASPEIEPRAGRPMGDGGTFPGTPARPERRKNWPVVVDGGSFRPIPLHGTEHRRRTSGRE
jgi:hypothetical protein